MALGHGANKLEFYEPPPTLAVTGSPRVMLIHRGGLLGGPVR